MSAGAPPPAFVLVVDAQRRVVESDAAAFAVGEALAGRSPLADAIASAVGEVEGTGAPCARFVRDPLRGAHWSVHASVAKGAAEAPWRARVIAVDATAAVADERDVIVSGVVHAVQNLGFGLRSVLEALEIDRPTGARLDEYLAHLRDPADRLAATMRRLAACAAPPELAPRDIDVRAVLALARERTRDPRPVAAVEGACPPLRVHADVDALADALVAMLESGGEDDATCAVDRAAAHVRVSVERRASQAEHRAVLAAWDLAGTDRFDVRLRLAAARGVILAHGGDVEAELPAPGRLRLAFRLPVVTAG